VYSLVLIWSFNCVCDLVFFRNYRRLAPSAAPAAIAAPLLILAHAAEASKEKEITGGSTSVAEASKEKETAGGSTTAATSRDDCFLGRGRAIPGASTTSAAAPKDPKE
jgi:hypothetical protein